MTKMSRTAFAALLIAAFATPALANDMFHGEFYRTDPGLHAVYMRHTARAAFAHAMRGSPVIYQNGQYMGQDPDPNVRLQLERDYPIQ